MATLKPTAPLLAPNKGPLKPAAPLRPKTAPKTPISHPQRRWRFHSHTDTSEQRRSRFQTTGTPDRQGLAGRRADAPATRQHARPHWCGRRWRGRRAWLRCPWAVAGPGQAIYSDPAPLVWKAPEGPEGTGGLRGAAPNEVRPPSLAGGRDLRRPEHQRGHKQPRTPAGPQARNTSPHTARGPKRRSASGPTLVSVAHRLSWM